ncbi:MAG: LysM peptidoglycan-binding domain-containing protein [Kiritimatiellaeota bacterium]|nr:LysM peptidoglycan-binding domain-containing protein [Kiritimatiellota bacterium]
MSIAVGWVVYRVTSPQGIEVGTTLARHHTPLTQEIQLETPPSSPAAASAAAEEEPTDSGRRYTVKASEDVYAVCIRFGVSPSDLKRLNKLDSSDLKPGMVLKIPDGASPPPQEAEQAPEPEDEDFGQTYTPKAGEDLYAVCIRFGVSPSDLKRLNKLDSSDLKPGMVLKIPRDNQ